MLFIEPTNHFSILLTLVSCRVITNAKQKYWISQIRALSYKTGNDYYLTWKLRVLLSNPGAAAGRKKGMR